MGGGSEGHHSQGDPDLERIGRSRTLPSRRNPRSSPLGSRRWLLENLEHSLPAIIVGTVCVGLGIWFNATEVHALANHPSFWSLLIAAGATIAGGGVALTLVDDETHESPFAVPDGYVVVERSRIEALQQALAARTPRPAPVTPPPESSGAPAPRHTAGVTPAVRPSILVDDRLVRELSENVLREARARSQGETSASHPPASGLGEVRPSTPVDNHPGTPRRADDSSGATAHPRPPLAPSPSQVPPRAIEPAKGLESMLQLLEKGAAQIRPRVRPPISRPMAVCVSCSAPVEAYSEQVCVSCNLPLCDTCLDRSVDAGHPAICPSCEGRSQRPA